MPDAPFTIASTHNPNCLGCGPKNPFGLLLRLEEVEEGRQRGNVTFRPEHESGPGRVHGGLMAAALDELLGSLSYTEFGGDCMTAQLDVRFKAPGAPGDVCTVEGRVDRREGRKMWLSGELRRGETILATAELFSLEVPRPNDASPPS